MADFIDQETGYRWYVDDVKTENNQSDPVVDPETGAARIIRSIVIQADPSQNLKKEDVLEFHRPHLLKHFAENGLTVVERDIWIEKGQKQSEFVVFAILAPNSTLRGKYVAGELRGTQKAQDLLQRKLQKKK